MSFCLFPPTDHSPALVCSWMTVHTFHAACRNMNHGSLIFSLSPRGGHQWPSLAVIRYGHLVPQWDDSLRHSFLGLFLCFLFLFFGRVTSVKSTSDQQSPTFSENSTFPEVDTTSCTLFRHSFKQTKKFTATWRHVVLLKFTKLTTVAAWKWRCSLTLWKVVLVQTFLLSRYVTCAVVLSVSLCFKLLMDLCVQ